MEPKDTNPDSCPEQSPEELPAWERPESQTPLVQEPDNHRGMMIAVVAILFTLFFVLPVIGFGLFAYNSHQDFRHFNQPNSTPPMHLLR